jgi:hypothetical protein
MTYGRDLAEYGKLKSLLNVVPLCQTSVFQNRAAQSPGFVWRFRMQKTAFRIGTPESFVAVVLIRTVFAGPLNFRFDGERAHSRKGEPEIFGPCRSV